jgi:hypothetical protein
MENFLRGHVHAFQDWGGQPRVILYDNLRSAVLERRGDQIHLHPRLMELCVHYHFVARPCQTKGSAYTNCRQTICPANTRGSAHTCSQKAGSARLCAG